MDKLIVERALQALADIGAVRMTETRISPVVPPACSSRAMPAKATIEQDQLAPCGSSHCAGCYDVGDGRKIHPPKSGKAYQKGTEESSKRTVH